MTLGTGMDSIRRHASVVGCAESSPQHMALPRGCLDAALPEQKPERGGRRQDGVAARLNRLVQCATLFCTYPAVAARAAFARVTLARMSVALAVQMNGLGSML